MASITTLMAACQLEKDTMAAQVQSRLALWDNWLLPVSDDNSTGDDPGYDDDFQLMREEVGKLSGMDTELICQLAEKLLITATKDIRVATYYAWARLHRDGEAGLADGLELLAALMKRYDHLTRTLATAPADGAHCRTDWQKRAGTASAG